MDKLNLAVFNTQPPHLYFGGVERRILETVKRLSNDLEIKVYSGTKSGFKEPINIGGTNIIPCKSTDRIFPLDNWTFNKTLSGMSNSIKANVYESHNVSAYGLQKTLIKKGAKAPFIQTIHGVLADEYAQAQLRGEMSTRERMANFFMKRLSKIEEESAKNATLIVTISEYSKEKILQYYKVESAKIRIVPNGVDTEKFNPEIDCAAMRNRLGSTKRPTVLFVGRLIPRKGLSYLVKAAKYVSKEFPEILFVLVGEGPVKGRLLSEVANENLSQNFAFLGDVSETLLSSIYACSDVFAFPSIQEGQGIALLEAQSSAVPVIAFDITGVSEAVVNNETGLLVKPDQMELSEAILRLLSDNSLREKMGKKGRIFVQKNFTWDICAQRMLKIYHEALN